MPTRLEQVQSFTERLQQCQGELLRYICVLVRNGDDAQDVFQQTCLTLWETFDRFDPAQSFLAWACGIARHKASKFLAQHRRYRARFNEEFAQRLAEVQLHARPGELEARQAALPGCIDKLPPAQRELLTLCYGAHRRVADVAAQLGRPASGVHNSLRLIREKLMVCIELAVKEGQR